MLGGTILKKSDNSTWFRSIEYIRAVFPQLHINV
jgi:hypothetical protein